MKSLFPNSIQIKLLLLSLFCFASAFGQESNSTNKTLFGKQVRSESINPKTGQIRCATTEYEEYLQEKNPKRMSNSQFETWLAPLVKEYKAFRLSSKTAATIITIPVVVHVIHNGQEIGVAPNITDAQVQSQITVLNQDFRKMLGTPGYNTNPVGADIEIEFVLAKQDPNGNPTNGIDRVALCQPSWSDADIDATVKPATIWDPTKYMNMWCLKFTDSSILGYAQWPSGSGLPGLSSNGGNSNTDGVVSSYDVFGSKTYNDGTFLLDPVYNKGRTMTHEVGHWLGLLHIWGDETCGNDYCADTPVHHDKNFDCPTLLSCNSTTDNEMVENYMDYTDDACMNIFTQNQKDRILAVMNNSIRRKELKTSTVYNPITLYALDAEVKIEASCSLSFCGINTSQTIQYFTIYNRGTTTLTSVSLNYKINGGSNVPYNWTGSLATNKSERFGISINSTSNGTISASIVSVNGATDQRSSNNSASGTFFIPTVPANYSFTEYVFRLQLDLWGSETTWNIKDESNITIYSGGPYTDKDSLPLPTLISLNWTLANNKCYTFTINDSEGDGICCGEEGDGYYDIKSTDGSITVKSGASFTSKETVSFSTNKLTTLDFEKSNFFYLYPNPTKDIININVSNGFSLPNNYIINNSLGQIVSQKKVLTASDLAINTSSLSSGVYFITVSNENQTKTLQFIKE